MTDTNPPQDQLADLELDEDEAFLEQEGVPTLDQPFIQKYLDGRDNLVATEKRQRSDHVFREGLSPMAAEAASIVSAIRFEEQQTLWNASYEDNLAKQEPFEVHPGMMFSLAKERMESSKLWKIVKKMPKGALLHCHLEAMGDLDWLMEEAFNTEGICISAPSPLASDDARETNDFIFQYVKGDTASSNTESIWTQSYQSNNPIPIGQAADTFPGGKDAFIAWFKSRASITHDEAVQHHLGPNAIWRKFMACFPLLASLQRYEPIFRRFIRNMLKQLHEDGVKWVDVRSVFLAPYTKKGAEKPDEDFEGMLAAMQEEIDAYCDSEEGKGFWGARLIWTTVRAFSHKQIVQDMKECIRLKVLFPDLIAGYDLVGQEDAGRCLAELTPLLFWFKKRCAEEGVDIPFFFHAGETLGDGDEVDENLFDAVLLGTRRIGHGFSLYKHPLLIEMVKDKRILVESCPVSNEVLRLTSSITSHPLPALLSRGVPCSLCNDDPAILGQGKSGMTHDFWQALQGWENLGLPGLASLAENSVRWAAYEDCSAKEWAEEIKSGSVGKTLRGERMREWTKEFEKFCQWVVWEFGAENDMKTLD
ncbi:Metallo-dependent hydrolase [Hortaea werneckii]|nr:Metallo-dependent hydrolase [Hortaea werneckii]KAI7098003.1 Metallo-dependent hydrolase [Hortaea werneckii]KAI7215787.1 Metallo-dependent hydrolase [Hortaea werneckii]KAI7322849.1 Metallo-dependent hydrolase [Hortaea werneckii]